MTNTEILEIYLKNRLILTCCECQFANLEKERDNFDDFFQDLCLIILEYDNEKLNKIHEEQHFNAFLTRIIQNNLFSVTSPYYKQYRKFEDRTQEITRNEMQIPDE